MAKNSLNSFVFGTFTNFIQMDISLYSKSVIVIMTALTVMDLDYTLLCIII